MYKYGSTKNEKFLCEVMLRLSKICCCKYLAELENLGKCDRPGNPRAVKHEGSTFFPPSCMLRRLNNKLIIVSVAFAIVSSDKNVVIIMYNCT